MFFPKNWFCTCHFHFICTHSILSSLQIIYKVRAHLQQLIVTMTSNAAIFSKIFVMIIFLVKNVIWKYLIRKLLMSINFGNEYQLYTITMHFLIHIFYFFTCQQNWKCVRIVGRMIKYNLNMLKTDRQILYLETDSHVDVIWRIFILNRF